MKTSTYLLLSLRYMNPFFRSHIYPSPWRLRDYMIPSRKTGGPFFLSLLLTFPMLVVLSSKFQNPSNILVMELILFGGATLISYFFAKFVSSHAPYGSTLNMFDRKTTDMQLVIMLLIFAVLISLKHA